MNQGFGGLGCAKSCWLVAVLGGVLIAILLMLIAGLGAIASIFLGLIACIAGGFFLTTTFCKELPGPNEASISGTHSAAAAPAPAAAPAAAAPAAPAPAAAPEPVAQAEVSEPAPATEAVQEAPKTAAKAATAPAAATAAPAAVEVKPSKKLAGEEELASRKGDWKYEAPAKEKPAKKATPAKPAKTTGADAAKKAEAAAAKKAEAAAAKKAEAAAAKKADAAAAKKAETAAVKKAEAAAAKSGAATSSDDVDYDGDGIIEGKNEGTRPAALDGPRGGKADDLKQIKGVGPKMEKLCNSLGFYHFDQIASWSKDEVAWVNANLEGFSGRVTRDTWVEQAKVLAEGGTTEFSKKVKKGNVY